MLDNDFYTLSLIRLTIFSVASEVVVITISSVFGRVSCRIKKAIFNCESSLKETDQCGH